MVMSRFWTLLFLVAACVLSFVGSESDPKGSDPINSCFCQLEGVLEDCPCEAATVDDFNQKLARQKVWSLCGILGGDLRYSEHHGTMPPPWRLVATPGRRKGNSVVREPTMLSPTCKAGILSIY